jgi:HEAT repeat protein
MRIIRCLVLGALGAALIAAWLLDGPFWLLTTPSGGDPAVRSALARLHSWRGSTRADAVTDLRVIAPPAAIVAPALVEHLDDYGWVDFKNGLSKMFSFHDGPKVVATYAYQGLETMGPAAVPALIDAMSNQREGVRMAAAELLGRSGQISAIPVLRTAVLTDRSPSVQNIAAKSLRKFHDRGVFDQLAADLHGPDPKRRVGAILLLESLAGADAVPLLREAATDPDAHVRGVAEVVLERVLEGR